MFELITLSLLGIAYVNACIDEANEEKRLKEEERIRDLKIKVFCYAVRRHMLYNQVVEMIQSGKLTFEEIASDKEQQNDKKRI